MSAKRKRHASKDRRSPPAMPDIPLCPCFKDSPYPILALDSSGVLKHANPAAKSILPDNLCIEGVPFPLPFTLDTTSDIAIGTDDDYPRIFETQAAGTEWGTLLFIRDVSVSRGELQRLKSRMDEMERTNARQRKLLDAERRLALKSDAANKAKTAFLANMSHEIRTPLSGVLGIAGTLLSTELPHAIRPYIEMIEKSGSSLLAIINDILDLSKIEAGKMHLEPSEMDMLELVDEIGTILSPKAEAKGIDLCIKYSLESPTRLLGDVKRIRQILMNLVGNAIKFTDKEHVLLDVRHKPHTHGRVFMEFSVTDTGIGIPEADQRLVFEKFAQACSKSTRHEGTGLGLPIAKQLVELMGGSLILSSQPGKGSSFYFSIPLDISRASNADSGALPSLKGLKILVANDMPICASITGYYISGAGADFIHAPSPMSALSLAARTAEQGTPFNAAVVSMRLETAISSRLSVRLKEISPSMKVFILSGIAGQFDSEAMEHWSADAFIPLPIKRNQFMLAMSRCLPSHGCHA